MAAGDLVDVAKHELREVDRRFLFWIALAVETASGSGASAEAADWRSFDWTSLREGLDAWLDGLSVDAPEAMYRWPVNDNLRLCFIAKPRSAAGARGYRRLPSLNIAEPDPLPPLRFEDGGTASLEALSIETVRDLALGHRRLAVELVSHRAAWTTLYELMAALGQSNTSELNSLELEANAAALSLVEPLDDQLGSFDDGWRAVHGLDVPMFDDPRQHGG
jgi:hypothetical protein